jgi:hypothetical protein
VRVRTALEALGVLTAIAATFSPLAKADSGHKLSYLGKGRYVGKVWTNQHTPEGQSQRSENSTDDASSGTPDQQAQVAQVGLIKKQAATIQTAFLNYSACMNSMQPAINHGTAPLCNLSFPAAATAAGTLWIPVVAAGAKSPTCGYIYQRPSLSKGSYAVARKRTGRSTGWSTASLEPSRSSSPRAPRCPWASCKS